MTQPLTPIEENEWQDFVSTVDHATFFDSPAWYGLWAEYKGDRAQAFLGKTASGKEVLFTGLTGRQSNRVISSAAATFGGFLCQTPLDAADITELRAWLGTTFNSFLIRTNPYCPDHDVHNIPHLFEIDEDFTQAIDLTKGFEACFKKWTKGHRSAAKKGMREGVEVRQANSPEDWDVYYQAYESSIDRWGDSATGQYDKKLFQLISKLPDSQVKLWLAEHENNIISGCLCFYQNKHVVYWHGAGFSEFFSLKGVHVLQYHIVQHAAESGFHWYDFNPSSGLEGVIHFKNGFGTEKLSSLVLRPKVSVIRKVLRKVKAKLTGLIRRQQHS